MITEAKKLTSIRSGHAGVLWMLALCLLWSFFPVLTEKDVSVSAISSAQALQQTKPETEEKLIKLFPGQTFSQKIQVVSPQYFQWVVVRQGIDVTIKVVDGEGQVELSRSSRGTMYGPLGVDWVGRPGRVYFVQVTPSNEGSVPGSFTWSFETRPSTATDNTRLEAQRTQILAENAESNFRLLAARRHSERALRLWRQANDRYKQAQSLYGLGKIQTSLGETQKSLEAYTEALSLFQSASASHEQARTLVNLGWIYYDRGRTNVAQENFSQALELSRSVNDRQAEAMALLSLGNVHERIGEPQSALESLLESLSISKAINDHRGQGSALLEIGRVYNSLGEDQLAFDFLKRARDEAHGDRLINVSALVLMAESYRSMGQQAEALESLNSALASAEQIGHRRMTALTLQRLGTIYSEMGDRKRALDYYSRALMIAQQNKEQTQVYTILNSLGALYESEGRLHSAQNELRSALDLVKTAGDYAYEPTVLYSLARVKRKQGDLLGSMHLMEQSLKLIDLLRYNIVSRDLRSSYFTSVRNYYQFYIDLLMELHKQRPEDGFASMAFVASERAHGQSLLELLSETGPERRHVNPSLLDREQVLRNLISAKISDQLRSAGNGRDSSSNDSMRQLMAEYDEAQVQIKQQTAGYKTLTEYQPLNLTSIQEQLQRDDTLLLEYSLGEERSYLWAVTGESISHYKLPGRAEIDQLARVVYELLHSPISKAGSSTSSDKGISSSLNLYWEKASELSAMLLGPVTGQLAHKRLLIVSDGSLQDIPFGALPSPTANEAQPLIFQHEVVSIPSASILMKLQQDTSRRKPIPGSVAILADPVFQVDDPRIPNGQPTHNTSVRRTFPRLYGSRWEAEQILAMSPGSEIAVGFDANRDAIIHGSLKNYQMVHFATHAVLAKNPALSGIVLSLVDDHGKSQNGFLSARDIANLDLSADLVVLSACQTGTDAGINGMTSSLFYAGAQSVLTSLWAVEDTATADLMTRFYAGLFKDGMTPAAALRSAQIEMWKQPRWQHPYYWAAFSLQGNGDVSISRQKDEKKTSRYLSVIALPIGISLIGLACVMRIRLSADRRGSHQGRSRRRSRK